MNARDAIGPETSVEASPFALSIGADRFDAHPRRHECATFDDLVAVLDATRSALKGRTYFAAAFADGHRSKAAPLPQRWLPLDIDAASATDMQALCALLDTFSSVRWFTHSHRSESPHDYDHRLRAVLELDRACSREELARVGKALAARLRNRYPTLAIDESVFRPEQCNYAAPPFAPIQRGRPGKPLGVDVLLSEAPAKPAPPERPPRPPVADAKVREALAALSQLHPDRLPLDYLGAGHRYDGIAVLMFACQDAGIGLEQFDDWCGAGADYPDDPGEIEKRWRSTDPAGATTAATLFGAADVVAPRWRRAYWDGLSTAERDALKGRPGPQPRAVAAAPLRLATEPGQISEEEAHRVLNGSTEERTVVYPEQAHRDTPAAPSIWLPARVLRLDDLSDEPPPSRHWFRADWLTTRITLLAGAGGTGKTMLALAEAAHGALGRAYFAPECTPYRSLFWGCEDDDDELRRRVLCVAEAFGLSCADLADNLTLVGRCGSDNMLFGAAARGALPEVLTPYRILREQIGDTRPDVVWLDNLAYVFGGNENDRAHVMSFANSLNALCAVTGKPLGIVLVAHPARSQGSEFAGSGAWENAARTRLYFGDKLPNQKADPEQDGEPESPLRFLAKRKVNYSTRDYVRFTAQAGGVLVPEEMPAEGGMVGWIRDKNAEEVLVRGFAKLADMGIHGSDGASSPDYLPKQLLAKGLAEGCERAELKRALDRLMRKGTFKRGVVGRYGNRNPRQGLILTEEAK